MKTKPIGQKNRPKCSIPLEDADLSLNNSNWTKGLQSMSDWIWSGNLNPVPFPNNLGKFFLQIPGTFEQQLNYSTTLIFDEPSFKNGIQISGFINRVQREMIISFIGQKRKAWYTITHHAILGFLTATKHGLTKKEFSDKWSNLLNYKISKDYYSELELELLEFANCFATDPKKYSNESYKKLRKLLKEDNIKNYASNKGKFDSQQSARYSWQSSKLKGLDEDEAIKLSNEAYDNSGNILSKKENENLVNSQLVELSFLCLQFVALSCVFSGINIPDEDFLSSVLEDLIPPELINTINEINEEALRGDLLDFIPPSIGTMNEIGADSKLISQILKGKISAEPAILKGNRIPFIPYEGKDKNGNFRPAFQGMPDTDKGLTIGGIQVGVYGWSFGGHFPGSLPYTLMHHPELSRYVAPYSLPVIFNEDEWRNGVQTAGYTSRKLKELVIQKQYRLNRCRYGIEHHTMFLYNEYYQDYGVGRTPNPNFTIEESNKARKEAQKAAKNAVIYMHDHLNAPSNVYSDLEISVLSWVEKLITAPHFAYKIEDKVREELKNTNLLEIESKQRTLDSSPKIGKEASMERLINHQISELAMLTGHMDGLGRVMTMLQLEAEDGVQVVEGSAGPNGGIIPDCNDDGEVKFTGYFNNRFALHDILPFIGIDKSILTINELFANPKACTRILKEMKKKNEIHLTSSETIKTGEF